MSRGYYNRGRYKFTARRRAALKKAQAKSAQKRRRLLGGAAAIAGIGAVAYLGVRHKGTIGRVGGNAARAVNPFTKEKNRTANAISVGNPSATVSRGAPTTEIGWYQRAQADKVRQHLNKPKPAPAHMRGKTDRNTERATRSVVRAAKKGREITPENVVKRGKSEVTGKKTASLKGTPGGTKTPSKANPKNEAKGMTDEEFRAAMGFDFVPVTRTDTPRPRGPVPQRDPLHTLAKMRYEDEKLLGKG